MHLSKAHCKAFLTKSHLTHQGGKPFKLFVYYITQCVFLMKKKKILTNYLNVQSSKSSNFKYLSFDENQVTSFYKVTNRKITQDSTGLHSWVLWLSQRSNRLSFVLTDVIKNSLNTQICRMYLRFVFILKN